MNAVPLFSLWMSFSLALGLVGVAWRSARQAGEGGLALVGVQAGVWSCLGAIVGGRGVYIALAWESFKNLPVDAWLPARGGLAWPGALVGGLAALGLYAAITRQRFWPVADALMPLVGALAVGSWLGCWAEGTAYGPLTAAWWGVPARDEWGQVALRWPVQLLGAVWMLELFWLLDRPWPWLARPGRAANLSWLGLCLGQCMFSLLRADPALTWRGLRLDTWSALFLGAFFACVLYINDLLDLRTQVNSEL